MADENTDQTTDTSVNEEVTTSTAEEDVDLEDMEVSFDDFADEDEDESDGSESDDQAEDAKDVEVEEDEADADSDSEEEADDQAEDDSEDVKDEEESSEAKDTKGKPDPDKAREAYLRRQIQREEREKQERETLEQYLAAAKDDQDELAKRQLEVQAYTLQKEKAALNVEKLEASVLRAKAEIPLLQSKDPVIQEALGEALDDFQRMYVQTNEYGDVISVTGDLYDYLQRKSDAITRLTGVGARQESKSKAKQKARTSLAPSKAPKPVKEDPDLVAFDEAAAMWD